MNLTVEYMRMCAVGCFLALFFSIKILTLFQQCGYRLNEFYSCVFVENKTEIRRLSIYSLIYLALEVAFICLFKSDDGWLQLSNYALSVLIAGSFYFGVKILKYPSLTKRFIRISIISYIISGGLVAFASVCLCYFQRCEFRFLPLCIIPLLSVFSVAFGWLIDFPYTKFLYFISVRRCKKRLSKNKNLIKIGITGSFGKTTTKNYLFRFLSLKYKVLVTPSSYNTPLGICKTVSDDILLYDVFIAEMGARYKNDIKTLCKIVKPSIGVITGISEQHTKTLKNIEGVKFAKNQLIDGLIGEKYAVFSSDSEYVIDLYEKAGCHKSFSGISGGTVSAKDIKQTCDGIYFTLILGKEEYKTFCPLLGIHNISDICLAIDVALFLGVEKSKILSVIPTLKSPPHRAEVIKTQKGITIIDDGYNANLKGIESTSNAIRSIDGYKIAVTSGIVELGEYCDFMNQKVGEVLAETFDLIVCVGRNSKSIIKGVGNKKETISVSNLNETTEIIKNRAKSGDVVAFFNDIPDRY